MKRAEVVDAVEACALCRFESQRGDVVIVARGRSFCSASCASKCDGSCALDDGCPASNVDGACSECGRPWREVPA